MKHIVEVGRINGQVADNIPVSNHRQAMKMAFNLVRVLSNEQESPTWDHVSKERLIWTDGTFYVACSVLDGVPRGSAYSKAKEICARRAECKKH